MINGRLTTSIVSAASRSTIRPVRNPFQSNRGPQAAAIRTPPPIQRAR